ncbi:hypothetical protein BKA69DRAFT_1046617 [Paraphysoderma sedebokerense]|nr:hypothetical protein BKA69DRAFT_1046617 [Paraphysoderma sedebokerense]
MEGVQGTTGIGVVRDTTPYPATSTSAIHTKSCVNVNPLDRTTPKWPRVTNNSRNVSSEVMKFGHNLGYKYDLDRYKTDAAEEEKRMRQEKKEKDMAKWNAKREKLEALEKKRWEETAKKYVTEQKLHLKRQKTSRSGASSVGYNLITSEYCKTSEGQKQKMVDDEAKAKVLQRAQKLYAKNNTFNPLSGKDVTKDEYITFFSH